MLAVEVQWWLVGSGIFIIFWFGYYICALMAISADKRKPIKMFFQCPKCGHQYTEQDHAAGRLQKDGCRDATERGSKRT